MHRFAAVPLLALAFAVACENTTTAPEPFRPDGTRPSYQEGPSDVECVGALTGTFQNVIVPQDAFCLITNSRVTGNIKALENSTLFVGDANTISGNVEGDKANTVEVFTFSGVPNVIHGSIFATETFRVDVCGAVLPNGNIIFVKIRGIVNVAGSLCGAAGGGNLVQKGSIKVEDSFAQIFFEVTRNQVAQNIQIFKNIGPAVKRVQLNTAGESIQCKENAPPFIGTPNTAPKQEDQCAMLTT